MIHTDFVMKVYLSVDIEGAAGIAHWDEARKPGVITLVSGE